MYSFLLAATPTAEPSASAQPSWTDEWSIYIAGGGLLISIIVAIFGWVQLRGAKGAATAAQTQADAAKDQAAQAEKQAKSAESIANEAKAQTAAAERSAKAAEDQVNVAKSQVEAAEKQTKAALDALELEQEPNLVIRVRTQRVGSAGRYGNSTTWTVKNTGRSYALETHAFLSFDEQGQTYGSIRLGDVGPDASVAMRGKKALPELATLFGTAPGGNVVVPKVTLEYKLANGTKRSVQVSPLPEVRT